MHILVLALALLPAGAHPGGRDGIRPMALGRAGLQCHNAEIQRAKVVPKRVTPGKLGQQPTADRYLTVLRLEDGCDKPVKIRQDIGDSVEDQR